MLRLQAMTIQYIYSIGSSLPLGSSIVWLADWSYGSYGHTVRPWLLNWDSIKSLQKTLHLSEEKIRIDGTKCVAGMERGGAGKGMMLTQVRSQEWGHGGLGARHSHCSLIGHWAGSLACDWPTLRQWGNLHLEWGDSEGRRHTERVRSGQSC